MALNTALIANPAEYSFPVAEWIALEHAAGDSLKALHQAHPDTVPNPLVIKRWRRDYPAFEIMMREAEQARAEVLADETISIADNPRIKSARAGHQIRARQWLASKLDKDKYGNHQSVTTTATGETDGEAVYSDDELQAIIRAGMKANSIDGEASRIENADPGTPPHAHTITAQDERGLDPPQLKIFPGSGATTKAGVVLPDTVAGEDEDF